ncbi:hypothetical protein GGI35DRAFT_239982 [Trichoderma velutinum]
MLHVHREPETTSWMGFSIEIPLGASNEDDGFGVIHTYGRVLKKSIPVDHYKILVSFPLDSMFFIEKCSADILPGLPKTNKKFCSLKVHLKEPATIKGFGIPFARPGHPSEGFINRDVAIRGKTLVDILQQESFHFCRDSPAGLLRPSQRRPSGRVQLLLRYCATRRQGFLGQVRGHMAPPHQGY